jgi:hypothetical protein
MINKSKNKLTIADSSPFTKHFKDIEKHVLNEINNDYLNSTSVEEENEYYCPEYIASLLKRYMPYCFVWSGFVLRNLNNENTRTRFTNGTVENHFYSNKGKGQFFKRLLPAQYASKSFKLNIGKCREFMSSVHDNQQQESHIADSADEEERLTCRERWAKKEKYTILQQ